MRRTLFQCLAGLGLVCSNGVSQETLKVETPVLVVPTLEAKIEGGKVVAWSAAMPSMWRALCNHLGTEKIVLEPKSVLAEQLNGWRHEPSGILPKNAQITLAGRATASEIKAAQERLKGEFGETWPELDQMLLAPSEDAWFALSMLRQSLRFEPSFIPEFQWAMIFKDSQGGEHAVKCFGSPADEAERFSVAVSVLRYQAPNSIISIQSKLPGERLFLCSQIRKDGDSAVTTMAEMVGEVERAKNDLQNRIAAGDKLSGRFGAGDLLEIPEVHFSGEAEHLNDLAGTFRIPGRTVSQQFSAAWHRVKFDLDEQGVKIEAKAFGMGFGGAPTKPAYIRGFVFDRPFFLMAWRDDAPLPYFVAFIDNGSVLVPSSGYTSVPFFPLPPSFRNRCSASHRLEALKKAGGSPEHDAMAVKGMVHLRDNQNSDGSWSEGSKPEATAIAVLVFLARCETPDSPFFGDNVLKGILWMLERSEKESLSGLSLREVALMTQAVSEAYVLGRVGSKSIPGLRDGMLAGVDEVLSRQQPDGTWGGKDAEGYVVTGLCLEALDAARRTSLKISGLKPALDRVRRYFIDTPSSAGLDAKTSAFRAAVALLACSPSATLAEPGQPEVSSVMVAFPQKMEACALVWDESDDLDRWLLIPLAISRYPDLTQALMRGVSKECLEALGNHGNLHRGPTSRGAEKDAAILRALTALLVIELPYRHRVEKAKSDSIFEEE